MKKRIRPKIGNKTIQSRAERIASCDTCHGRPPVRNFEFTDMKGTCCNECLEVISHTKK